MKYFYFLQTQAPDGNWVDCLGSYSKKSCIEAGKWQRTANDKKVRVVKRTDRIVWK